MHELMTICEVFDSYYSRTVLKIFLSKGCGRYYTELDHVQEGCWCSLTLRIQSDQWMMQYTYMFQQYAAPFLGFHHTMGQGRIRDEVRAAVYFSIMAYETLDVSKKQRDVFKVEE